MTGIDISGIQSNDVPGPWEFIVVKSTEGTWVSNPKVSFQWANASRTHRGLYHYSRPMKSNGTVQGHIFAKDALARGFKKDIDMFQLDCEDMLNAGVTSGQWQRFIDDFMAAAVPMLGKHGYLYAGWPFVKVNSLQSHIRRYNWWLPSYSVNDGKYHSIPSDVPSQYVVIHQFTSKPLDKNEVLDKSKYSSPPAPVTPTIPEEDMQAVVVDWNHGPGTSGRDKHVLIVMDPGQFSIWPVDGAKIAGPGVTDGTQVHVVKVNGNPRGVGENPSTGEFVIAYSDGGTFKYKLV